MSDRASHATQTGSDATETHDSTSTLVDSSAADASGDGIQWRYLEWDTILPSPAFPVAKNLPDGLPSQRSYEKFASPLEWPATRKRLIIWLSCLATAVTAGTAGSYTAGDDQMSAEWHVSKVAISLGVTTFTCGFAIAPMVLAPFSEINGRRPVFVITGVLFTIFQLCSGVTRSFPGMLVARFFKGCASSTFSTMVGGVVADIYTAEERNTPMALFAASALFGTGLGPLYSGFIAAHVSWRWIFYVQTIECAVTIILIGFFFKETRASVLLSQRADALNKYYADLEALGIRDVKELDTSGHYTRSRVRWKVKSDEERSSIAKMISISLYRPFHLLFTEPVVFFFSLWISFSWVVLYLTFGAIPLVFETLYGFSLDQAYAVFAALCIASLLSMVIAIQGDKLLVAKFPKKMETPEGRLVSPCFQSCLLPIGLFWFAWTSYSSLHWILPTMGLAIATMGIFSVYLAVFNYLSDCYGTYASSALAAQSFCRNLAGGAIPLVVVQMYNGLGFHAASSLLGGIGVLLTAVPFFLVIAGPKIRARSKFASGLRS